MMARVICWWLGGPTHPDMDAVLWPGFRDTVGWWLVVFWLVSTALIVGLYSLWARRRRIRSPDSLFLPYAPLGVLWLAAIPAVMLFLKCRSLHDELMGQQWHSYAIGPAAKCGLWGASLILVSSYLLMLAPGVTPRIYRYRPMAWLLRRKVRQAKVSPG